MERTEAMLIATRRLRNMVASDGIAASYQSLGVYRTEVLRLVGNITGSYYAGKVLPEAEPEQTPSSAPEYMPWSAIAYPAEHPYPVALRIIEELRAAIARYAFVDVENLTRYTSKPMGGMEIYQEHGPWVLINDVRNNRIRDPSYPPAHYNREDAETFAQALIAQGWYNEGEGYVDDLHDLLGSFLKTHTGDQA
ncbi:hypothetical protein INH39_02980 [Massilia violaceinigra]|uniref:Uncharacterized protein n=1 Tax=Massilia violaceinigra TaxID=2045208 RepID=A0ABY4A7G4_9BURK|nr:hypothetical protein [Massilia violaceinigra]UOD30725.1 hypothetical protein INH39_02980 [Massilia violaceinigra]